MGLFSFHHRPSTDPDVDSVGAIESLADLSNGIRIVSEEEEDSRDGELVRIDAEYENEEAGSAFVKLLRTFRLLY